MTVVMSSVQKVELIAFGMRLATKDERLPDVIFENSDLEFMFAGEGDARIRALVEYLLNIGVSWEDGSVVDAIALEMKAIADRRIAKKMILDARKMLEKSNMVLDYPNIAGVKHISRVVSALTAIQ